MALDEATKLLVDPATLEALPAQFDNLSVTDNEASAGDFVRVYEEFLKKHPNFSKEFPDVAEIYQRYLNQAKWIGFKFLSAKEIRLLLSVNFSAIFTIPEYDVVEHIKNRLRVEPFETRDALRKIMSDALAEGVSEISRSKITTNTREEPGTVGNWVKDYRREVGEQRDAVKRAQYISGGANIKKLAPEERERVKKLIEVHEYLQLSSVSPEGFEDDTYSDTEGRGLKYFEGGKEVEVEDEIAKRAREILAARSKMAPEALLALYKGSPEEQEAIRQAAEEIQKKSKDPKVWEKMLVDAVAPMRPTGKMTEVHRVAAILRLLSSSGQLEKALSVNSAIQQLVIERYQGLKKTEEIAGFKMQPNFAQHLAAFLRAVFEDRLKLSESDSARFGMQIANILRAQGHPELIELVHFDERARGFRWL